MDALELAQRAVSVAEADETLALVNRERSGQARFAGSEVHQPTLIENEVVELQIVRDGRLGLAASNRTDDDALKELATRAGEAADSAPADPNFPGFAPPTELPSIDGYDEETASLPPEEQARLATAAIDASSLDLYGYFTSGLTELALASTGGLAHRQAMTDAGVLTLAAVDGASGYAEETSWQLSGVDPVATAERAVEKAERTRGAIELEPGSYAAVLEPYAFAELLLYFAYDAFGARGLIEERSFASGKVGEKVFDERFSLAEDSLDPRGLPKAFDFEGTPKQRVELVENGVLSGVLWDRRTAREAGGGHETTGNAPPASARQWGPLPFALSIGGGEAGSTEELAELVGDGIYITRLHYLSIVNPREGVITGMTRDGTFRVRGGKIADPLVNLRFTVSVPAMLEQLHGLTSEPTLVNETSFYDERYPNGVLAPAVATARFDITGVGGGPGT
jgi:predicted Zn-dependent protease